MAAIVIIAALGSCMMSSLGGYMWVRSDEEAILDAAQAKKDKEERQTNLLAALGNVKNIMAQTIELVNDQPLNIQEMLIYDRMENNLVKDEMITGGYDTASVSIDLGAMTEIPGMVIVNNKDNGGVIGAKIRLLDESGKLVHESKAIKDLADAYDYDPNFKTWQTLSFVKVGRNEDGTKFS